MRSGRCPPEEENSEPPVTYSSPETSPEPYQHPSIEEWERDIDWEEHGGKDLLSCKFFEEIKKIKGKLSCVDESSTISWEELAWLIAYYEQKGKAVVPLPDIKPHRFDIGNHRIPRIMLTPKHVCLGVGAPMHSYYEDICNWYDLAPIQLSPNSYRLAAGLYILYRNEGPRTNQGGAKLFLQACQECLRLLLPGDSNLTQ